MPNFTITLSAKAVARLNALVQRTNEAAGTTYTLKQWLTLHLKELAIADEMPAAVEQLRRESQDNLTASIAAERDRLLQEM